MSCGGNSADLIFRRGEPIDLATRVTGVHDVSHMYLNTVRDVRSWYQWFSGTGQRDGPT
jgi:hypothetical protein